jgi:hypothetical protein
MRSDRRHVGMATGWTLLCILLLTAPLLIC